MSLPSKFNPKVSDIEETANFETLNKDKLLGSLTTYEMRIPKGKWVTKDETFKADKYIEENECSCLGSDEEEANCQEVEERYR